MGKSFFQILSNFYFEQILIRNPGALGSSRPPGFAERGDAQRALREDAVFQYRMESQDGS